MTLTAILQNAGTCANAIGKASDKVRLDPRRVASRRPFAPSPRRARYSVRARSAPHAAAERGMRQWAANPLRAVQRRPQL